jgi:hypothetical protein
VKKNASKSRSDVAEVRLEELRSKCRSDVAEVGLEELRNKIKH